jgi:hypothetical protein
MHAARLSQPPSKRIKCVSNSQIVNPSLLMVRDKTFLDDD